MLNIYYSKTVAGCLPEVFKNVNNFVGKCNNIIFTPDRMTLQIEELLFKMLNNSCFFDVDVTTLTRFTNKIIGDNSYKVLTKPVCVAIIKNILLNNKPKFKTIKKAINFNGFAATLFDTISMFKSCNITPSDLNKNFKNTNLNLKIDDIKFVYEQYELFLENNYTDSFNKLNLLATLIKTNNFKNTNFYFLGFNDFTPQMYNIIRELVKYSKSVNIATAYNKIEGLNNKHIFLNNTFTYLLDLAKLHGFNVNTIYCKQQLLPEFDALSNNLFSINPKFCLKSESIKLYKSFNTTDEINFVIKYIQSLVTKGYSYNDFVIVVPSLLDYKNKIKSSSMINNLPIFVDESSDISSTVVLRFYLDLFNLISKNYNKSELFAFLKMFGNLDLNLLNEFEKYIIKSGFNYNKILTKLPHEASDKFDLVYEKLSLFIQLNNKLNTCNTISEYVTEFNSFAEVFNFADYLSNLKTEFFNNNNVLEFNKLCNTINKLNNGMSEIVNVVGEYATNLNGAINIICAYFENITIVIPPIVNSSVLICDMLKSELPNKKIAFVLGMQEGNMPKMQSDLGLILDSDLNLLNKEFEIGPKISFINKRNKFKVYENLLKFEKLVCTYNCQTESGEEQMPSEAIENIKTIFDLPIENLSLLQSNYQDEFSNKMLIGNSVNLFEFNNINPNFAQANFINNFKDLNNVLSVEKLKNTTNLLHGLKEVSIDANEFINNFNFVDVKPNVVAKTLKNKKDISVSQLQTFYRCPYKHFVSYGLKLKSEDNGDITAIDVGDILHQYIFEITPLVYKQNSVDDVCESILNNILNKPNYEFLVANPNNKFQIKSLYKEILKLNKMLYKIKKYSNLTPTHLEHKFNNILVSNKQIEIMLKGTFDRIDSNSNGFVVYDYKTGKKVEFNLNNIANGTNFQLAAYLLAANQMFNKAALGALFIPVNNTFSKKEDQAKLAGVTTNQANLVQELDSSLAEFPASGAILPISRLKSGEFSSYSIKKMLSEAEFETLINYTKNLILQGVSKIKNGVISASPTKYSDTNCECDFCEYLGMCKFNKVNGTYSVTKPIKTINDLEI